MRREIAAQSRLILVLSGELKESPVWRIPFSPLQERHGRALFYFQSPNSFIYWQDLLLNRYLFRNSNAPCAESKAKSSTPTKKLCGLCWQKSLQIVELVMRLVLLRILMTVNMDGIYEILPFNRKRRKSIRGFQERTRRVSAKLTIPSNSEKRNNYKTTEI